MANNFSLPGIKKMNFSDYMNNNNYLQEPDASGFENEPYNTLNKVRTDKAFQATPEAYPMAPESKPTLLPKTETSIGPEPTSEPATTATDDAKKSSLFGGGKKIFGMEMDEFAQLAGGLAEAIAPTTAQGRAGGAISRIAGSRVKERRAAEAEAPEKALAARLTEARIADLQKDDDPKTAMSWYLQQNPKASEEEVSMFKKSLSTEKAGNYWRTTSNDGTVSIYKGGDLIHTSKAGVGQTKSETLHAVGPKGILTKASEAEGQEKFTSEKTAAPVSWTTATNNLGKRFGKQDALGNIIITPELAQSHRVAQKKLVELKDSGLSPLDAINKSEEFARNVESRYWLYIDKAKKEKNTKAVEDANKAFKGKYGYIPRTR